MMIAEDYEEALLLIRSSTSIIIELDRIFDWPTRVGLTKEQAMALVHMLSTNRVHMPDIFKLADGLVYIAPRGSKVKRK